MLWPMESREVGQMDGALTTAILTMKVRLLPLNPPFPVQASDQSETEYYPNKFLSGGFIGHEFTAHSFWSTCVQGAVQSSS